MQLNIIKSVEPAQAWAVLLTEDRSLSDQLQDSFPEINIPLVSSIAEKRSFKATADSILSLDLTLEGTSRTLILAGIGQSSSVGILSVMQSVAAIVRKCSDIRLTDCTVSVPDKLALTVEKTYKAAAMGAVLGDYRFDKYKAHEDQKPGLERVNFALRDSEQFDLASEALQFGKAIAEAVCFARDLGNEPSNVVTPEYLANLAVDLASQHNLEVEVWDRENIQANKMGLLSAVARGSKQEPRFIRLSYKHPEATQTIALLGKGITFDTGGYSLKPSGSMDTMKDDMTGAADVLAAMTCIAQFKPAVNVHALIPATENCIGGSAIHPGDVFVALSGKTVEVNNTDAEGRLVLADAAAYACSLGVDAIVDMATLTGACVVALGNHYSGLLSNNDTLADQLISAAAECGEKLWRLPLDKVYLEDIKSNVAQLKNTGGRQAGVIIGGLFIGEFVGDTPWAHVDLSAATLDSDSKLSRKGSSGAGVGMLIEYVLKHGESTGV